MKFPFLVDAMAQANTKGAQDIYELLSAKTPTEGANIARKVLKQIYPGPADRRRFKYAYQEQQDSADSLYKISDYVAPDIYEFFLKIGILSFYTNGNGIDLLEEPSDELPIEAKWYNT